MDNSLIHDFFIDLISDRVFAASIADAIEGIQMEKEGNTEDLTIIFTLPALFEAVCYNLNCKEAELEGQVAIAGNQNSDRKYNGHKYSYKEFRSALYSGTLNDDLKKRGYQVVIHQSTGRVDTSAYQLTKV